MSVANVCTKASSIRHKQHLDGVGIILRNSMRKGDILNI